MHIRTVIVRSSIPQMAELEAALGARLEFDRPHLVEPGQMAEAEPRKGYDFFLLDADLFRAMPDRQRLMGKFPGSQLVVLASQLVEAELFAAVMEGAAGYLLLADGTNLLADMLVRARQGGVPMSPAAVTCLLLQCGRRFQLPNRTLSARQKHIIAHLAAGHSHKEISNLLGLSQHTVYTHLKNVFSQINVSSSTEALCRIYTRPSSEAE